MFKYLCMHFLLHDVIALAEIGNRAKRTMLYGLQCE